MKINLNKYKRILLSFHTISIAIITLTIALSLLQYLQAEILFWDRLRPQYNNYLIYVNSFKHLIEGSNLYDFYPNEYGDQFKYSPTFAFFMGLFYYLPDWIGLTAWNLLNVFVLLAAIKYLPGADNRIKVFILLFIISELIANLQNEQSNTLMSGLLVITFGLFERKKMILAAMVIAISIYVKVFGLVAAALFILYPNKFRFIAYLFFWTMVLWVLPLIVTAPEQLFEQYSNWIQILQTDGTSRYGFSIFGVIHRWLSIDISKWIVLLAGIIMFCSVYIRNDLFRDYGFRVLFISSILIWVVLFNHAAESSSYIISMTGVAIWYFMQKRNTTNTILAVVAFLLVSILFTDITPFEYKHYLYHYYVKTIPVFIIWLRILYEMLFNRYQIKV